MTELFPFVYITYMHFDYGGLYTCDGIRQGYRGVRIGPCIEQYTIEGKAYLMKFIYQFTLHIVLIIVEIQLGELTSQFLKILLKCLTSINLRFSFAEKIQIGAIDDNDFHFLVVLGVQFAAKFKQWNIN